MKCRLLREMKCRKCTEFPDGKKPAGTEIEHRDAFRLVQMGCAEPADEECAAKAGMTPERAAAAQAAYEKVSRGIHPDDYAAYDAGLLVGYNPDGSWIPGPNAAATDEDEDLEENEEG